MAEYKDFTELSDAVRNQARQEKGMPLVSPYGKSPNISQEDREATGLSQSQAEWHQQPALPGLEQPRSTHLMVPSRPFSEGGAIGSGHAQLGSERNPTAEDWGAVGPSQSKSEWTHGSGRGAHHATSGDQLRMFMSPREIMDTYQVLDADRQEAYDERAGEPTNRAYTTGGEENTEIPSAIQRGEEPEYPVNPHRWNWQRNMYGSELERHTHVRTEVSDYESDEQVWSRKLEESQLNPRDYGEIHGMSPEEEAGPPEYVEDLYHAGKIGSSTLNELVPTHTPRHGLAGSGTWNRYYERLEAADQAVAKGQGEWEDRYGEYAPSLHEHIEQKGVDQPVHLGRRIGSQGKPEVVGGHHRIAAAANINPDQLIPVLHHESIKEARWGDSDEVYKYT